MRKNVSRLAILSLLIISMGCGEGPGHAAKQSVPEKKGQAALENPDGAVELAATSTQGAEDSLALDTLGLDADTSLWAMDSEIYDDTTGASEDPNIDYADDPGAEGDDVWEDEEDDAAYNSIADSDMDVEKDKLISTALVRVLRPEYSDQRDSVLSEIEKRLTITPERIPATVVVEKWISPVNFRGYKFNQRKLLLFGVREEQNVVIFYYVNQYYFALGERFYELDETLAFEPFQNLADTALVRHLRAYENSL